MRAYLVDILAVGFFILEWTVYALTLEHTAYGRLFTTTAAEVIVTWRRQFVSIARRAMGSQSAFERSIPTDLIRGVAVRVEKTRQNKSLTPQSHFGAKP